MATGKITIPGWKLLWTNPSPNVAFSAQTVSIDLSNYSMIMVLPRGDTGNVMLNPIIVPKADANGRGLIAYSFLNINASSSNILYRRIINGVYDDRVVFNDAYAKSMNSTSAATVTNTACIPYQIFGR